MAQHTVSNKSGKNTDHDGEGSADVLETLKTRVEDVTDDIKTRVEDARDTVQTKATDMLSKVRDQITANPIQTVAMALTVGYMARIVLRGPIMTIVAIGAAGYLAIQLRK